MIASRLSVILRLSIAAVFLLAGASKLVGHEGPTTLYDEVTLHSTILHLSVIAMEIGLAFWLASGWKRHISVSLAGALLACMSAVVAASLLKEHPAACGCFGAATSTDPFASNLGALARNFLLISICGYLFITDPVETVVKAGSM